MKRMFYETKQLKGFSLAELLAALTVGSLVLVAVLGVYSRVQRASFAVMERLDKGQLSSEILQRIAEDLDKVVAPVSKGDVSYTKVTVENKLDNLFSTARLTIEKNIYDNKNEAQTLEKIVWQTNFDYDGDANSLILYRSHSGIALEDKLLDESKEEFRREMFIPICSGVTFFKIQVPQGSISAPTTEEALINRPGQAEEDVFDEEDFLDEWNRNTLPGAVVVTVSFGSAFKRVSGEMDVADEEKVSRTIAIDRTRMVKFDLAEMAFNDLNDLDVNEPNEPNELQDVNEPERGEPNIPIE